jgi:hypothetical protein
MNNENEDYKIYIDELTQKVVKNNISNIVYNNITEKFVIYFKNYEFINDLNDDDKYYLQYNLKYNLNTYITKYYNLQSSL